MRRMPGKGGRRGLRERLDAKDTEASGDSAVTAGGRICLRWCRCSRTLAGLMCETVKIVQKTALFAQSRRGRGTESLVVEISVKRCKVLRLIPLFPVLPSQGPRTPRSNEPVKLPV